MFSNNDATDVQSLVAQGITLEYSPNWVRPPLAESSIVLLSPKILTRQASSDIDS